MTFTPCVPKTRAVAHYAALAEKFPNLTRSHFCALAGIAPSGKALRPGCDSLIRIDVEERILAVTERHVRLLPPRLVPKDAAVAHLRHLLTYPYVTRNSVAKTTGLSAQTMCNLLSERYTLCHYTTHVGVLGLSAEEAISGTVVRDHVQTIQRVRSLQANGWSLPAQTAMAGLHVGSVLNAQREVSVGTFEAIAALYHRLGDTRGPDVRAAAAGHAAGYYPPIHYDDNGHLIPSSIPKRKRKRARDEQHASRMKLVVLAHTLAGLSAVDIVTRTGEGHDNVDVIRRRAGVRVGSGNESTLTIMLPDELDAAIDGVDRTYRTDAADDPGIDYKARWRALVDRVDAARTAEQTSDAA